MILNHSKNRKIPTVQFDRVLVIFPSLLFHCDLIPCTTPLACFSTFIKTTIDLYTLV